MSKPVYVNGTEIYKNYKARLLGYSVGPVNISNAYQSSKTSVIPVKLKESIGTRIITLNLEFEGDTCYEAELNISNLTAYLLNETELELPDGFFYFCILDQAPTPENKGGTFYTASFKLVGYRHGAMETEVLTETGSVFNIGNCKAPAIITIEGASGSVTVNDITVDNISKTVVINGYDKTVMEVDGAVTSNKYKDCTMTKFPSLDPGTNMIAITGTATVTVEYTPIYM